MIASVGVLNWRDGLRRSDHADTRHDRSDTTVGQMRMGACTGTRRPLAFDREADDGPLVSCVDADQPACDARAIVGEHLIRTHVSARVLELVDTAQTSTTDCDLLLTPNSCEPRC